MRKTLDYKCLFESAPGLFLVLDPELHIVAASDDFIRATMTRREEILGKTAFEIFPNSPDDSTAGGARNFRDSLQYVLHHRVCDTLAVQKYYIRKPGGKGAGFEERYCSMLNSPVFAADGSVAWIINRLEDITGAVRLLDNSGWATGVAANLDDITTLDLAKKALLTCQRNLWTLSNAVEQSPASVVITSTSGEIVYVNLKFTEVTGYSIEELLGKNPRLLNSGRQPPEFYKQLWDTITSGRSWRGEFCNRKKNGELYWESAVIAPILDKQGTITHFMALKEDITRIKQLEHEVLEIGGHELQRIGQELHDDVCQWLSGSVMVATVLAKDLARESSAHAERALEVAALTRHTLESLRALAQGLTPAVVQSEGLAGSLLKLAKTIEEVFHIHCCCDFECPVRVRDENAALHLYRIAQEAITNAVRHGGAREVSISFRPHKDRVSMLIRDDGTGIHQPLPKTSGMGLRSMRYRAELIGATLEIQPGSNGGTELVCNFPNAL